MGMCLALLVALALLASPLGASAFSVCIIESPGFSSCDINNPVNSEFLGYDVELFSWIANYVGWQQDQTAAGQAADPSTKRYAFKCQPLAWSAAMAAASLNTTYNDCHVYVGSITITTARISTGIQFGAPWYRAGLGMLIASQGESINRFAFMTPFHWTLWLAFILSVFVMPALIWFVERVTVMGEIPLNRESVEEWHFAQYKSMLSIFNLEVYQVTTLPAQVLVITTCFMVLIVVSTYTANLAAVLTTVNLKTSIARVQDLRGKAVAAHGAYQERLYKSYGLVTIRIDFEDKTTWDDIVPQLEDGSLVSYIDDQPTLQWYLNQYNSDCRLMFVGGSTATIIEPFDFSAAFHKYFPPSMVLAFNKGVVAAQEASLPDSLKTKYIELDDGGRCSGSTTGSGKGITFDRLSGLWIILGAITGACLLYVMVKFGMKVHRLTKEELQSAKMKSMARPGSHGRADDVSTRAALSSALSKVFVRQRSTPAPADGSVSGKRVSGGGSAHGGKSFSAHGKGMASNRVRPEDAPDEPQQSLSLARPAGLATFDKRRNSMAENTVLFATSPTPDPEGGDDDMVMSLGPQATRQQPALPADAAQPNTVGGGPTWVAGMSG